MRLIVNFKASIYKQRPQSELSIETPRGKVKISGPVKLIALLVLSLARSGCADRPPAVEETPQRTVARHETHHAPKVTVELPPIND